MWTFAVTGSTLFIAGALKFAGHLNRTPTLEDYLAFRCGPAGAAMETSLFAQPALASGHCWGCYAMSAGAVFASLAAWRWMTGLPPAAQRRA